MLIGSVDMSITVCLFVGSGVDLQMPPKNSGGAKKHKTFDHFFATSALDTAYLERTKMQCQSTICPVKVDLLSVTFDPKTA